MSLRRVAQLVSISATSVMQITKNGFGDFELPPGTLPPCISACFAPQSFITELERLGKNGFGRFVGSPASRLLRVVKGNG
jgi:hypothetical protein